MNKSESIKELAIALSKAQVEMKPAELNKVNPFLKKKYADLGSIITAAKPVLGKNGLSLAQFPISNDDGGIGITTILMHSSGEWIESTMILPVVEEKGKSSAQVAGSIISYLRRYSIASVLGIYADEDVDGNGAEPTRKPTSKPKPEPNPGDNNSRMSLEAAKEMLNSSGEKYGNLEYEKLTYMQGALVGALKRTDFTDEERHIREQKLEAIALLLDDQAK